MTYDSSNGDRKMTYQEAMGSETTVSVIKACREIREHGVECSVYGKSLVDCHTGEHIATIDSDGMVHSSDVLAWLGY